MEESKYRESWLCRLLGSPVVYRIEVLLLQQGPLTPVRLAKMTGRSVQTISGHLAKLRTADVVRYEIERGRTRYWVKPIKEIRDVLESLKRAVGALSKLR